MNTQEILEILTVFLLSAVKFSMAGVPAALVAGFSFFKTVTVTTLGGFAGTIFFAFLSEWLIKSAKKIKGKVADPKKVKKKFTFTNKLVVKAKMKLGLTGLAILTPALLSFPFGVFLAVRYFKNKTKIISYMLVSTFAWSVALYFCYKYVFDAVKALL